MSLRVITSSQEALFKHDFNLDLYDSCNETTLLLSDPITEIRAYALNRTNVRRSINVLTDSVSKSYNSTQLCGRITYTLLDKNFKPAPDFISIEFFEGW